jgi:predicted Zn-dependent protease
MKTLKYLTIGSFLWLVACQQQETEVSPEQTNNSNPAPVVQPKSWALTTKEGKEAYDELVRLVFKTSDGSSNKNVVKWTESTPKIQIFIDGPKDATMNKAFDGILAEIKTVNKVNTFEIVSKASDAKIVINKDTFENHNAEYPNAKAPNSSIGGYTVYTYSSVSGLTNATVWINPNISGNNLLYILRHEFTHSLGLGHTTNINSVMFSTANTQYNVANYAPLDKKILEILFDKRIKQGMSLSQADAIIKEYLK